MAEKKNISVSINEQMKKAFVFNDISPTGINEIETKNGLVASKEYTFLNQSNKRISMKTFDRAIIESTEKIAFCLKVDEKSSFIVCKELAKLDDKKILESIGFKSIADYAFAMFDISRVTAQQYARIGRIFINDDYTLKTDILPSSLTKGHLIELLAVIKDDDISSVEEMYLNGILTDGLSTSALRKRLKEIKKSSMAIEGNAVEKNTEDSIEISEENNVSQLTQKVTPVATFSQDTTVFEKQKSCARILSLCNDLQTEFQLMADNGLQVSFEQIETIKEFIANLLQ